MQCVMPEVHAKLQLLVVRHKCQMLILQYIDICTPWIELSEDSIAHFNPQTGGHRENIDCDNYRFGPVSHLLFWGGSFRKKQIRRGVRFYHRLVDLLCC